MVTYKIKNRNNEEIKKIKEDNTTLFLYNTFLGRILLKILTLKFITYLSGLFLSTRLSILFIKPFAKKNNLDLSDYEEVKYKSFNEFFARKIKEGSRPINKNKDILISPCDGKLSVYKIDKDKEFIIKGTPYKINELINNSIANEYSNGYICIIRLCVDDYHRYSYIDNGYKDKNVYIKGIFHTVRPIVLKNYNIYKRNAREWTILHTENFGEVIHIEVGALMVGKIVNHHKKHKFKKGEEKGYFKFGGSTICLLFKENKVKIDDDLIVNSNNNIETIIKLGEQIGKKIS